MDFTNRISAENIHNVLLTKLGAKISNDDLARLRKIKHHWDMYDGFHWETLPDGDKPQVTVNYVRAFVDKFISFELGRGFNIKMEPEIEKIDGENDPLDFLNDVWEYNNKLEKCVELGQTKAITGDGWIQVSFESKYLGQGKRNPNFKDPFDEYEKGRIRYTILPSAIVFPEYYDAHDKDALKKLTIQYPLTKPVVDGGYRTNKEKTILYKQVWTDEKIEIYEENMNVPVKVIPNKYGFIPIKQTKNYPLQGRNEGLSDVEDIIPLNMEINLKKSDISEIIDYHSAPVTVVFGARIGQLERGASKVWGGLPKDARIENLRLEGDLNAAQGYISELKTELHQVGNIPEGVLGGELSISNTSGVALQIALMPLLERVRIKQVMTKVALEWINKATLLIAEKEGLITIPKTVTVTEDGVEKVVPLQRAKYFKNEVTFDSVLPKDTLLELQELELEMRMGLETREDAMKRRGKENIQEKIVKIDKDMEENPSLYGKEDIQEQIFMMKEQAKIQSNVAPPATSSNTRKVGQNKEGKPKQVNAGYQNGPSGNMQSFN